MAIDKNRLWTNDSLHRACNACGGMEWHIICSPAPLEEFKEIPEAKEAVQIIEASREVIALQEKMQEEFQKIMEKYGLTDWYAVISVVSERRN